MVRRWFRRRRSQWRTDLRTRLATDAANAANFLAVVLIDARRLGAPTDPGIVACAQVWRSWAERLAPWAHGDTDKGD
jgi:hypothetical protein